MRKINIYDTYEGKVREFKTIVPGEVSIYYCGPTVYDYAHLGNFRCPVFFDLVHRLFKAIGYKVKMVSNYTDIDDKIINRALSTDKSEKEVSEFYIKNYEEMLEKLNVLPLYSHPKVSDYMTDIIDFISLAIEKNVAYKSGEDIYFSVDSCQDYGSLSKMNIEELDLGSRISVSESKKSPLDFALWKKTVDNGIKFDTPFGSGRPGWHTECLVMINKIFKSPLIDIHGGGFDLKFPHHENERAQASAVYGSNLANYWMHVGFLNLNGEKMSKSLGNVIKMKDLLQTTDPDIFRLVILKSYYRSPLIYGEEAESSAKREIEKYRQVKKNLNLFFKTHEIKEEGEILNEYYDKFLDSLCDDFNVANALSIFDSLIKSINSALRMNNISLLPSLKFTFNKINDILGLRLDTVSLTDDLLDIYRRYEKARLDKDYELSDALRKVLIEKDVI